MEASEVLYSTPTAAAELATTNALSTEMSLTPTTQTKLLQQQQPTPLSPLVITTTTTAAAHSPAAAAAAPVTPTTPRTTTHTPREIPTMYFLDQMYDDYMDQYLLSSTTVMIIGKYLSEKPVNLT
ncbi:hypothetical protein CVS40_6878 [Lucilia cuprina]|nr:hypothetical protein CVS40_6878 [Lucilia cuprina]KAI8122212.1 hypothetical protein CVS40_6878 [Lucilia cuprina]KAI8122213.1 hypothetical protein CVS40_6878 [Lucilia cuprina]